MALTYNTVPLQSYSSMEQIKDSIRQSQEPALVVVTQIGCKACDQQVAELRKYLFYKANTPIYKVQAKEFNSSLPEDYRIQQVPVMYKAHSSYGLKFGKCGVMPLEEIQSFMGSQ